MKLLVKLYCTCFGAGFAPLAPGTVASLLTLLVFRFVLHNLAWPWYLLLLLVMVFLGVPAAASYAVSLNDADPRSIVVDEVCGQLAALFLVPVSLLPLFLAFVFFRFFDIIKPYPIRRLEKLPGGWGIMADDLAAGIAAGILVHVVRLWV